MHPELEKMANEYAKDSRGVTSYECVLKAVFLAGARAGIEESAKALDVFLLRQDSYYGVSFEDTILDMQTAIRALMEDK